MKNKSSLFLLNILEHFFLAHEGNFLNFAPFFLSFSSYSTDESLTSSYNNLLTAPSSYHQPLQTSSIGSIQSSGYQGPTTSHALEHSYNNEFYPSATAGIDEQYIYVTYPSAEMKKRLSDRYDQETLLVLTNDEHF